MIRKIPFMLIALCFLLSCGGDDPLDIKPEDDIKPEQPEKPSEPDIKKKRIKALIVNRPTELYTEDKLVYDNQGRITRIESYIKNTDWFDLPEYNAVTTFTYLEGKVINKITCNGNSYQQILELNDLGYVEKLTDSENWSNLFEYWGDGRLKIKGECAYQYLNGNLTVVKGYYFSDMLLFEMCSIPNKAGIAPVLLSGYYNTLSYSFLEDSEFDIAVHNSFYLFYNGLYGKPSANLESTVTEGGYALYFEYELDKDGYPKKIFCTELNDGMPIPSKSSEEAFTANIEYFED